MAAGGPGTCLLPVLLSVWMAAASDIAINVSPSRPLVNNTATLRVSNAPEKFRYAAWYSGNNSNSENNIARYNSDGTQTQGKKYFQEALILADGSLEIRNLQMQFQGNYTVAIHDDTRLYTTTAYLAVHEPEQGPEFPAEGLSPGAIAGIVIGCVAAACLCGVAVYMITKKGSDGPL